MTLIIWSESLHYSSGATGDYSLITTQGDLEAVADQISGSLENVNKIERDRNFFSELRSLFGRVLKKGDRFFVEYL